MFHNRLINQLVVFVCLCAIALSISLPASVASADNSSMQFGFAPSGLSSNATVFATSLNNPRGLKFGPDGKLYVAEGGVGGSSSTVDQCVQVHDPIGPYTGSKTGARISEIDHSGRRTTVVDNLPSSQTTLQTGSFTSGVADVAFVGRTPYAVLAGAGCSHGVPEVPNAVIRIGRNRTWTQVANLSAFQQANPVAHPNPGDFELDGTWYSLVAVRGALYAVEPNHGLSAGINTSSKLPAVSPGMG